MSLLYVNSDRICHVKRNLSCLYPTSYKASFDWKFSLQPLVQGFPRSRSSRAHFPSIMRELFLCFPRAGMGSFPPRVPWTQFTPEKRCLRQRDTGDGSRWEMSARWKFQFRWQHNDGSHEFIWTISFSQKICKCQKMLINSLQKEIVFFLFPMSRWEIFIWDSPNLSNPIWTRWEFYWEELTYSAATQTQRLQWTFTLILDFAFKNTLIQFKG